MEKEKSVKSALMIFFLTIILFCVVIIVGTYMNNRWKKMRDIRRSADVQQVIKVMEVYQSNYNKLPDNETRDDWDKSYDPKTSNQTLFKTLRDANLISPIFDPVNNEQFLYKYHKFDAGEYGCDRAFAIFQIVSFEEKVNNIGSGFCPDRDFTKEAPNGYTIQWFE